MKIAVEFNVFGHVVSELVDYPGIPKSHGEVVQWLMNQIEIKWVDYDNASAEDKFIYDLNQSLRP